MSDSPLGPTAAPPAREILGDQAERSLLDLVDHLLNQGVVASGDLVLGLADVDLVYLRLSALLCAADRVLPHGRPATGGPPTGGPPTETAAARDAGDRTPPHGDPLEPRGDAGRVPRDTAPEPDVSSAGGDASKTGDPEQSSAAPGFSPAASRREASTGAAAPAADDDLHPLDDEELESLRGELEDRAGSGPPARWNADPENARRAVAKLVLAVVDFLRQLMERQAIRRMDAGTLTDGEVERVGLALMRLEETLHEMAERFGIPPEELNLDLGPLGRLT